MTIEPERWAPINGWEALYAVSDTGKLWSYRRKRILIPYTIGAGYVGFHLADGDRRQRVYAHHLVAEAFLPPKPGPRFEINHINLDKTDNRAVNLEWVLHARNQDHAAAHDRMRKPLQRKLTPEQVRWVRANRGESGEKLASQLGVTSMVIYQIWNGLTYRDIG